MRTRHWLSASLVLVALVAAVQAWAEEPGADRTLEESLTDLEKRASPGSPASGAVTHARHALDRARTRRASGDEEAAQRAELIAEAALLLADRRLALAEERGKLSAAEARAVEARERARAARLALESALSQRARALGPDAAGSGAGPAAPDESAGDDDD